MTAYYKLAINYVYGHKLNLSKEHFEVAQGTQFYPNGSDECGEPIVFDGSEDHDSLIDFGHLFTIWHEGRPRTAIGSRSFDDRYDATYNNSPKMYFEF